MPGPQTAFSDQLHAEKYRAPGEDFRGAMNRIAFAMADNGDHYHETRKIFGDMRFMPAGRIQAAMGSSKKVTSYNCFVSSSIEDSFVEGENSIMGVAAQAAQTMRMGGGIGYDFSTLRPNGALIKKLGSKSSGPLKFMGIYNEVCNATSSSGNRRGAQMGVLRVDHPDIVSFIHAKNNHDKLNGFNISVAVTDPFMEAVELGRTFELKFGGTVYDEVDARSLYEMMMRSTWDWAEPGILFIDTINRMNNLWYCETIAATNPCVTGDTWVQTSSGPEQVSRLVGKSFMARVDGLDHATGQEGFFSTGVKPVFKIVTTDGFEIRATADHPLMQVTRKTRHVMETAWTKIEDLKVGDRLRLHNHRINPAWDGSFGRDEGYLMGLLVGDGTITADAAILSVWKPAAVVNGLSAGSGVDSVMSKVQDIAFSLPHRSDFSGWKRIHGRDEWRLDMRAVADIAERVHLSSDKSLKPAIERTSSGFYAGFLSGLFDADGSIQGSQDKGVSIRLAQSDLPRLKVVQRMLARLGIMSKIYENRRVAGLRSLPDGNGGSKEYFCKDQHELTISGDNLVDFESRVGFADTDKAARLRYLLGGYRRQMNAERFDTEIAAIIEDGEEEVFDVQVPGVNAFDANGIMAHNCGEQPLSPNAACLLGSYNLTKYIVRTDVGFSFETDQFIADIPVVVRAMDNVIDRTLYPLPQQEREAKNKRRMGLGFTGVANALETLGLPYGSKAYVEMQDTLLDILRDEAYRASIELAKEKGPFPLFDADNFLRGEFVKTLPDDIKDGIRRHGIRNSHLTSIAPTGTISAAADNISSSIEPVFEVETMRPVFMDGGQQIVTLKDYAYGQWGTIPKTSEDVTLDEHLAVLLSAANRVDSAVSKTCNTPGTTPWEDFKNLYRRAWEGGAKGCTTFNKDGKRMALLTKKADAPREVEEVLVPEITTPSCEFDPATGRRSCE